MAVKRSSRRKKLKKQRPRRRTVQAALTFDSLEQRRMLTTLTVSNSSDLVNGNTFSLLSLNGDDGGDGISLREAITASNNFPGSVDTIRFDPSVFTSGDDNLIRLTEGELVITDGLRIDGTDVGGVVITGDANGDDVTVSGTHITDVSASFGGSPGASSDLLNDNSRVFRVSGAADFSSRDLDLVGLTITGGRTVGTNGSGGSGGGILSARVDVSLTASTIAGNSTAGAFAPGGGIRITNGFLSLTDSTVSGNSTTGFGSNAGGIRAASNLTLINSTVSGNSTDGEGGGISASSATIIRNSTISGNSSRLSGGGIRLTGILEMRQSTVANNNSSAANGGGVYAVTDSDDLVLTVRNSIVAGNVAAASGNDFVPDPDGETFISFSLIGDPTGINSSILDDRNNIIDQAARLGPLADNGGRTQTHALLVTSPAIDAASSNLASGLSTDQRGFPFLRAVDNPLTFSSRIVDMGSFELQTLNPVVVVDNRVDENDGDVSAGNLSLREAIDLTNDNLGANTITFDPSVFTGGSSSLIRLTQGELVISETVTIDASDAIDVVITGDAGNNDVLESGTLITDVAGSSSFSRLDDNSRVLNFSNTDGNLTLSDLTITGGSRTGFDGAGIAFSGEALVLNDSKVSGNRAFSIFADGGGIRAFNGDVFLTNSTVSDNSAFSSGGGIFARDDVFLINSTVSGNRTRNSIGGRGGGIFTEGAISLVSSTVSGNSTVGGLADGGGIAANGAVSLISSTVSNNTSGSTGGGIFVATSAPSITISNSIIAGNTDDGTAPDLRGSSSLAINYSLIGATDLTIAGNGNQVGTLTSPLDPRLEPLADNGGPTLTHALLPGSPAIDAGNNALAVDENGNLLTTDQRGETRIQGGTVDIGAVEFEEMVLLGDADQNGQVDFRDIAAFINLLTTDIFLDEADVNRDGFVSFLDIVPFIAILTAGGSSSATSESVVVAPPASSVDSLIATSELESTTTTSLTVEAPVTTEVPLVKTRATKPAPAISNAALIKPHLQGPLVLVNDTSALPLVKTSNSPEVEAKVAGAELIASARPVDTYIGPVAIAPDASRFLGAQDSSLQGFKSFKPMVSSRPLKGSVEGLGFSLESKDSFATASKLFDANPETLDEVFDFEFKDSFAGLTG